MSRVCNALDPSFLRSSWVSSMVMDVRLLAHPETTTIDPGLWMMTCEAPRFPWMMVVVAPLGIVSVPLLASPYSVQTPLTHTKAGEGRVALGQEIEEGEDGATESKQMEGKY